jgi:hypothetical protein
MHVHLNAEVHALLSHIYALFRLLQMQTIQQDVESLLRLPSGRESSDANGTTADETRAYAEQNRAHNDDKVIYEDSHGQTPAPNPYDCTASVSMASVPCDTAIPNGVHAALITWPSAANPSALLSHNRPHEEVVQPACSPSHST